MDTVLSTADASFWGEDANDISGGSVAGAGDVNGDGYMDLVSHYRTQDTGISKGDTEACLTGETTTDIPFEGCDDIKTVGK